MNTSTRRWTGWKIAAFAAAAFILLLVAFALWIHWVAVRRFAKMEIRVRDLHAETLARNVPRRSWIRPHCWPRDSASE